MLHLQIYFILGWLYSFSFGELLNQNFRFTSNYLRHLIIARRAAIRPFCTHLQISELHLDCPSDLKHMQCTLAVATELYWQKNQLCKNQRKGVSYVSNAFTFKYFLPLKIHSHQHADCTVLWVFIKSCINSKNKKRKKWTKMAIKCHKITGKQNEMTIVQVYVIH